MVESKPKVFISYAYSSNEYTLKVERFAQRLFSDGVEAMLDLYEAKPGKSLKGYTERCLKDPGLTRILILLSPSYRNKADSRGGKALIETRVISKEMYEGIDKSKVVPILFDKLGCNEKECVPSYLRGEPRLDLSEEKDFESGYLTLLRLIYGKASFAKPSLGERPAWLEDKEGLIYDPSAIERLRGMMLRKDARLKRTATEYLRSEVESVPYSALKARSAEEFKISYHCFKRLRWQYLAILNELLEEPFLEELLRVFFLMLDVKMIPSGVDPQGRNLCLRVLKHELIVETIALLYEGYQFSLIGKLVLGSYPPEEGGKSKGFREYFYSRDDKEGMALDLLLANDYSKGGRRPFSGLGAYWVRHLPSLFLSVNDFSFADVLIFNLSVGNKKAKPWFPVAYVYSIGGDRRLKTLASRLKSKELAKKYLPLFQCEGIEELRKRISSIEEFVAHDGVWKGYKGCAYEADALSKYLKSEEVGDIG